MTHAFYLLDRRARLQRLGPLSLRRLLAGRVVIRARDLHLVTVARDAALLPTAIDLVRIPLTGGRFTEGDALALRALASPACATPAEAAAHHRSGWPPDLAHQLAVALDVPVGGLGPVGVGGPVLDTMLTRLLL